MTVRRLGPGDDGAAAEFLADPACFLFVAEEAGERVGRLYGYELARPDGRRAMLLYDVEVDETARRRGHGRALVEALLAEATARGHFEMWVLTEPDNEAALGLYESTGAARDPDAAMLTWRL